MAGLILCNKHSETPYYVSDMDVKIYSLEELAYFLYNNAYFIEKNFFSDNLIEYIERDLNLSQVATDLKYAISKNKSTTDIILLIVQASKYYSESEVDELKKTLEIIENQDVIVRMKSRADMLFESKKYASACKTYVSIIEEKTLKNIKGSENQTDEFYASVYCGIGKIEARMFQFRNALKDFKEAYHLHKNEKNAKYIIKSLIMMKMDKAEIELECKKIDIDEFIVNQCVQETEKIKENIEKTSEYLEIQDQISYNEIESLDQYYNHVNEKVNQWKKEYRDSIS